MSELMGNKHSADRSVILALIDLQVDRDRFCQSFPKGRLNDDYEAHLGHVHITKMLLADTINEPSRDTIYSSDPSDG